MRPPKHIMVVFIMFSLFSNCSSLQSYFQNRALDFTDIMTLGAEVKSVGGSAWLWCFGGGIQLGQFGDGWGMRNGYLGYYRTGGNLNLGKLKMGNSFFLMNSQEHLPEAYTTKRSMHKKYTHANFLFFLPANLRGSWRNYSYNNYSKNPNNLGPNNYMNYEYNPISSRMPMLCHAPVNIELSFGLGVGGRVGFNFSELLDFILGFTTYDLMNDDAKEKQEVEEQ